jgi:hypothetical protein
MAYVPPPRNPKPKPPPYQPQQYNGGTSVPTGQGQFSNPATFTPPAVPSHDASGHGTSVDTPSLDLFASNIDLLIDPVHKARTALQGISVEPGAFYHANKMRTDVNGPNADDGLKKQFDQVLTDLASGLADLRDGIRTLSAKYTSLEEANKASATDLQNAFDSSTSDFNQLITDSGGTPSTGASNSNQNNGNGNGSHNG